MARYPKKSNEEKLARLDELIEAAEEKLASLREEKEALLEAIQRERTQQLFDLMDAKGLSFEELEQFVTEWQATEEPA